MKERLIGIGYEPRAMTPEQFSVLVIKDLAKIGKIVKDAGIKAD